MDFKENWGGAEPERCCNVVVEATNPHRLHPTSKSYVVYKVFQHLAKLWMGIWVRPYTMLCLCRSGVEFRKIGVGQSLSDVVISWFRLQTCLECIPHPCHMYTQCFSTLTCRGWAHESTLTLLCLGRSRVDFGKLS